MVCGRLHLGAVAAVLGVGADVAAADRRGRTAVHALAAAQCSTASAPTAAAILRLLLRRGAQVRISGFNPYERRLHHMVLYREADLAIQSMSSAAGPLIGQSAWLDRCTVLLLHCWCALVVILHRVAGCLPTSADTCRASCSTDPTFKTLLLASNRWRCLYSPALWRSSRLPSVCVLNLTQERPTCMCSSGRGTTAAPRRCMLPPAAP